MKTKHFVLYVLLAALLLSAALPLRADHRAEIPVTMTGSVYGYSYKFQYQDETISESGPAENASGNINLRKSLKPGHHYTFSVSAPSGFNPLPGEDRGGECNFDVQIQVPTGYMVYTSPGPNMRPSAESPWMTHGVGPFNYTASYSFHLMVVEESVKIPMVAGRMTNFAVDDLAFDISLGTTDNGKSAGRLQLRNAGKTASGFGFVPDITSTENILYIPSPDTWLVNTPITGGRSIAAPQAKVDIVNVSSTCSEIRFYARDEQGNPVATPYTVYRLERLSANLPATAPANSDCLKITEIQGNITIERFVFRTRDGAKWALIDGEGTARRLETHDIQTIGNKKTSVVTIQDSAGTIVTKNRYTYLSENLGIWMTKQEIGIDGLLPTPLVSIYDYYIQESGAPYLPITAGNAEKLRRTVLPNGHTTTYDYFGSGPLLSRLKSRTTTWHDADGPHTQVTTYDYTGTTPALAYRYPLSEMTTIDGVVVSKTENEYDFRFYTPRYYPGDYPEMTLLYKRTAKVYTSPDAVPLITTTLFYPQTVANAQSERKYNEVLPNGVQRHYHYEAGTYANGVFTSGGSGATAWQTTVYEGTSAEGIGTTLDHIGEPPIVPIQLVAGLSTKTCSIRDKNGNVVSEKTYVYNGTDFDPTPIASVETKWTTSDRPDERVYLNGTKESWTWQGIDLESETDASGQKTIYTYDSVGRVVSHTIKGVGDRLDREFTRHYDAAGRVITEVESAGLLFAITTHWYDAAGRHIKAQLPDGRITTTAYEILPNGHTRTTDVLSCGGTRIAEYYPDDKPLSTTGSLGTPEYYSYSIDANGWHTSTTHYGSVDSPRWASAITDWAGRSVSTARPDFSTGAPITLTESYTYNASGLVAKITNSSGLADQLFEYDFIGRLVRSGSDIDGDGALTLGSATDRIGESESSFQKIDGQWWSVGETKSYANAGSDTAVSLGKSATRLSGFANGVIAESWQEDRLGNRSILVITSDPALQKATATTTIPGSNGTGKTITIAGLTQSIITPDGRSLSYEYDALGRQIGIIDSRTGKTSYTYVEHLGNATGRIDTVTDSVGGTTAYGYDSGGRVNLITNAAGAQSRFQYDCSGRLERQWGSATTPVSYVYNTYGEQTGMSTYRTGDLAAWSGTIWPNGQTADTTTWNYHEATGLLLSKRDAAGKGPDYTYTSIGQPLTRMWVRLKAGSTSERVTATYAYNPKTGEVLSTVYNDGTAGVSFEYNRLGLTTAITDSIGRRTFAYDAANPERLLHEDLPAYLGTRRLSYVYENGTPSATVVPGRLTGYALGTAVSPAQELSTGYDFDAIGRINTLNTKSYGDSATQAYNYAYLANTSMVESLASQAGNFRQSRTYETQRDLLASITVQGAGNQTVAANAYTHDILGRRTTRVQSGSAFASYGAPTHWRYGYDSRNQLTGAVQHMGGNITAGDALPGRAYDYAFDTAGNRTSANHTANPASAEAYTLNALNQIVSKENKTVSLAGMAESGAGVLINGAAANHVGQFWSAEIQPANASGPAWTTANIVAAIAGGSGQADYKSSVTSKGFFRGPAQETIKYDLDGNLIEDAQWLYTYDAENRLAAMETRPEVRSLAAMPADRKLKLLFAYDHLGRRVSKTVNAWDTGSSLWVPQTIQRFIYQGWNLIAEYHVNGSALQLAATNHWALDIAGSLTATGGVGALVRTSVHAGTDSGKTYHYGHDGSGNVTVVLDSAGALSATYEYSPFGELLRKQGARAKANPWRFSGKYADEETGLVYYGHRYYSPSLGRFINRDPIGEMGGRNLYAFVLNSPINAIDLLGLSHVQGPQHGLDPDKDTPFIIGVGNDENGQYFRLAGIKADTGGPDLFKDIDEMITKNLLRELEINVGELKIDFNDSLQNLSNISNQITNEDLAKRQREVPLAWLKKLCSTAAGRKLVADIAAGTWNVFDSSSLPTDEYPDYSTTLGFGNLWSESAKRLYGNDAFVSSKMIQAHPDAQGYGIRDYTVLTLIHETIGHWTVPKQPTPPNLKPHAFEEALVREYVDSIAPQYGLVPLYPGLNATKIYQLTNRKGHDMRTGAPQPDYANTITGDEKGTALEHYGRMRRSATPLTGWDCDRVTK